MKTPEHARKVAMMLLKKNPRDNEKQDIGGFIIFTLSHEFPKEKKKETKKKQVTFHQQTSIYALRLLACHSISHSVDYTP